MNKKSLIILIASLIVLGVSVYVGFRWLFPTQKNQVKVDDIEADLPQADSSITAEITKSKIKADTVLLVVKGLGGKISELKYEFEYDSQGIIRGVNSGNNPLDVVGKDNFEREIYLGTCSKNVCSPDKGVKSISLVLVFTDTSGKMSKYSKEFPI